MLNAVCFGTTYDQAWIVWESEFFGSPSSQACLKAFVHSWTRWVGWPKLVRCEWEGTHHKDVLGQTLSKKGLAIGLASLEVAENVSTVKRRGDMLNTMMTKRIKDTRGKGRETVGHDSQRMFERCQRNESTRWLRSSSVGSLSSPTCASHDGRRRGMP